MRSLAVVAVLAGVASAKPLPDGLKLFVEKGRPMVSRSGVIVPLRDDDISDYANLKDAHLSDDGAYIVIRGDRCNGIEPDDELSVPLAKVEARIENSLGMMKHVKKAYADAIPHFAAAVAKDPDVPMYATNLLSAQSLAKKFDDADATISALTAHAAPWLAWRLSVDPELANVKSRAKGLVAEKRGHLKSADLDSDVIGYSPLGGGLVVTIVGTYTGGMPPSGTSELGFASLVTGREVLRLTIRTMEEECGDYPGMTKCTQKQLAPVAKRRKAADALLAQLGFEKVDAEMKSVDDVDGLAINDDTVTFTRGKTKKTLTIVRQGIRHAAVFDHGVVLDLDRRGLFQCDDQSGVASVAAIALP